MKGIITKKINGKIFKYKDYDIANLTKPENANKHIGISEDGKELIVKDGGGGVILKNFDTTTEQTFVTLFDACNVDDKVYKGYIRFRADASPNGDNTAIWAYTLTRIDSNNVSLSVTLQNSSTPVTYTKNRTSGAWSVWIEQLRAINNGVDSAYDTRSDLLDANIKAAGQGLSFDWYGTFNTATENPNGGSGGGGRFYHHITVANVTGTTGAFNAFATIIATLRGTNIAYICSGTLTSGTWVWLAWERLENGPVYKSYTNREAFRAEIANNNMQTSKTVMGYFTTNSENPDGGSNRYWMTCYARNNGYATIVAYAAEALAGVAWVCQKNGTAWSAWQHISSADKVSMVNNAVDSTYATRTALVEAWYAAGKLEGSMYGTFSTGSENPHGTTNWQDRFINHVTITNSCNYAEIISINRGDRQNEMYFCSGYKSEGAWTWSEWERLRSLHENPITFADVSSVYTTYALNGVYEFLQASFTSGSPMAVASHLFHTVYTRRGNFAKIEATFVETGVTYTCYRTSGSTFSAWKSDAGSGTRTVTTLTTSGFRTILENANVGDQIVGESLKFATGSSTTEIFCFTATCMVKGKHWTLTGILYNSGETKNFPAINLALNNASYIMLGYISSAYTHLSFATNDNTPSQVKNCSLISYS